MASRFIVLRTQYGAKEFRFECRVIKKKIQTNKKHSMLIAFDKVKL